MPKTPRGIEYPDGTSTYPEAPWWERLASTANSAFDAVYTALGGKADTAHTHAEADVSGLVADLAGKAAAGHTHAEDDVLNLSADLNAITTDLGSVYTALGGKADTAHTHAEADVSGLVADLAGKAATSHTHTAADITDLGDPGTQDITGIYSVSPWAPTGSDWQFNGKVMRLGKRHAVISGMVYLSKNPMSAYGTSVLFTLPSWAAPLSTRGLEDYAPCHLGGVQAVAQLFIQTDPTSAAPLDVVIHAQADGIPAGSAVYLSTVYEIKGA